MFVIYINKKKNKKNYGAIIAILIATISSIISLGLYLYRFGFDFSAQINDWINTATYFNNLLSPIFLFITILLLYWTWRDTKEALEIQSKELSLQRKELKSNRSINERQLKTQKLKDDLDIFSRRINELDKKFVSIVNDKEIKYAMSSLILELNNYCSINSEVNLFEQFYKKIAEHTEVVDCTLDNKINKIVKTILEKSYKTDELLKGYLSYFIEHGEFNFPDLIKNKNKNEILSIAIGHILIESKEYNRRVRTLERVLSKVENVDNRFIDIYIEEVILHFDLDLIDLLCKTSKIDLPSNLRDTLCT